MSKQYFNIFNGNDGYFISHHDNGAKGSVEVSQSKKANPILIVKLELAGKIYKGILNKTSKEKLMAKPNLPTIWGGFEDTKGNKFQVSGWWTTQKKSGEPVKAPYFSCSIQEDTFHKAKDDFQTPDNDPDANDNFGGYHHENSDGSTQGHTFGNFENSVPF